MSSSSLPPSSLSLCCHSSSAVSAGGDLKSQGSCSPILPSRDRAAEQREHAVPPGSEDLSPGPDQEPCSFCNSRDSRRCHFSQHKSVSVSSGPIPEPQRLSAYFSPVLRHWGRLWNAPRDSNLGFHCGGRKDIPGSEQVDGLAKSLFTTGVSQLHLTQAWSMQLASSQTQASPSKTSKPSWDGQSNAATWGHCGFQGCWVVSFLQLWLTTPGSLEAWGSQPGPQPQRWALCRLFISQERFQCHTHQQSQNGRVSI